MCEEVTDVPNPDNEAVSEQAAGVEEAPSRYSGKSGVAKQRTTV